MKRGLSLAALVAALALAVPGAGADDKKEAAKDNTPPKGFKALFDGKTVDGWQGAIRIDERLKLKGEALEKAQKEANDKILPHWKVEEGVLINDGKGYNLATVKDYGNFELYVDWKIEPKGDSGIYLRGEPQVQIWDSDSLTGNLAADKGKGSGGLWNNPKGSKGKDPSKKADKAPGEWNTFRIIMKGKGVTVFLNGEKVVDDAELVPIYGKELPAKGKELPAKGPIELQQHYRNDGKPANIWFKNIYIKELPE
jgi:hypothetical protein